MTDEELDAMYVAQAASGPATEFAMGLGEMLQALLANGFSREVAEQMVLVSLKHSLASK